MHPRIFVIGCEGLATLQVLNVAQSAYQNNRFKILGVPSDRQLERHIRQSAKDSSHVIYTAHARKRMRERYVNDPMVLEVLRMGSFTLPPEPDMTHSGLKCRMQRFVAGMHVAVVVYVEYPETDLVVVTVIDVKKD